VAAHNLFGRDQLLAQQPGDDGLGHHPAAYESQLHAAQGVPAFLRPVHFIFRPLTPGRDKNLTRKIAHGRRGALLSWPYDDD
jgi:hypothetical protein